MSSSEAVTETLDEGGNGIAERVGALFEVFGPTLGRHAGSGNLAVASGVVSLVRAGRTFLKGNRKRGVLQALGGLFWIGVALAQRRSARSSSGETGRDWDETAESDLTEVADSSPDVTDAVEPGGRDTDHATGEDVVNTTDADIEESDTAPEIESDVDGDVDQRDVAGSGDLGDVESESESDQATESDPGNGAEAETDGGTDSGGDAESKTES
jgi:hypothetical protein